LHLIFPRKICYAEICDKAFIDLKKISGFIRVRSVLCFIIG